METAAVTTRKSLYIRGLQAAYAGVLEVLDDAFHAAVYRFFPDKSKWERMEIEGSAYVTRNSSVPLYSLIVLNKKGDADLILHCEENIEKIQVQDQYIMLRCKNDDGKVTIGIWIHDAADRERIYNSILRAKEIRKNSPDMNSLLSKYVNRQKSVASPELGDNSTIVSATTSVPPTPIPPKAVSLSASQLLASALSASISTSSLQGLASTSTTAVTSVSSSVPSSPQRPPLADKATALMSILKSSSKKDLVASNSNGNASLDDIIKAVDPVASVAAGNSAARSVTASVNTGSSQQQSASAKLLSLLGSAKSPSVTSLSSPAPSSSSSDFPTDGEISAKAKQRASNTSSPVAKPLVVGEDKVSALKSILSIGSASATVPKVPLSPAPVFILERRAASPVSLPPAETVVDLTLLSRTSSASPVTVAQSTRRHSPLANATSAAASLNLFSNEAVTMKRVQPKLISPSDLEVF